MNRKRIAASIIITAIALVLLIVNPSFMRFFRHEVVISIVGDVMLDRGVSGKIVKYGESYPFEGVSKLFNHDDLTIANLECPLTFGGKEADKEIVFKADPKLAKTMKQAGFDALMLANNHAMDYLSAGLSDTITALDGAGILYAGAGKSEKDLRPCIVNKNGVRIGILSYNSFPPEIALDNDGEATIATVSEESLSEMRNGISRAALNCDFLIVYFHWGIEYSQGVSNEQIETAHEAVDSGASLVVGSHPHVLQGRESYKGVPIYYSLGNFIFDRQTEEKTDESAILQLTVGKKGIITEKILPVDIKDCQVQLVN